MRVKTKVLLLMISCLLVAEVAVYVRNMLTPKRFDVGEHIPLAHASPDGLANTGCAECHTKPIAVDCASCHAEPPTTIDDIFFPHHDPSPGGPPDQCNKCHGGEFDARFAETPDFDHDYCTTCHDLEHSRP
ncbi:MAG: hypothetical protein ACE5OW_08035 [Candidatus Bathyarchaeia archaeon]